MREPKIYVGQFGAFWSFTLSGMKTFLERAIQDDGCYDLDAGGKRLTARPKDIFKNEHSNGYWSARASYYEPLDWRVEDFEHVLEELTASK